MEFPLGFAAFSAVPLPSQPGPGQHPCLHSCSRLLTIRARHVLPTATHRPFMGTGTHGIHQPSAARWRERTLGTVDPKGLTPPPSPDWTAFWPHWLGHSSNTSSSLLMSGSKWNILEHSEALFPLSLQGGTFPPPCVLSRSHSLKAPLQRCRSRPQLGLHSTCPSLKRSNLVFLPISSSRMQAHPSVHCGPRLFTVW